MFSEYQEWDQKDINRQHKPISDNITEVSSLLNYEGGTEDVEKPKVLEPIDYEFLNGLRGIGAFCVYLCHFHN
jgi:hypothetical protein